MTTISAIVTTTGRATLTDALQSIRQQTCRVDEVILIYDTPNAPQNIYADVQYLWTGGVGNPCIARNHGARAARSTYLAFLDDDDYWLDDHIDCAKRAIKASGASVLCASFWKRIGDDIQPEKTAPAHLEFSAFFCRNPGLRGSNLIIASTTYHQVGGFDVTFPALNDLDLGIRLGDRHVSYCGIEKRTVVFRQHAGPRLSTRGSTANREGLLAFWRRYSRRMNPEEQQEYAEWAARFWGFVDFNQMAERD